MLELQKTSAIEKLLLDVINQSKSIDSKKNGASCASKGGKEEGLDSQVEDEVSVSADIEEALQCAELARLLIERDSVTWDDLKRMYAVSGYSERHIGIKKVCEGSSIIVARENKKKEDSGPRGKSPELVKHLEGLQKKLDQRLYDDMVKDVTEGERKLKEKYDYGLSTYKDQLRYGAHVMSMMAAFFAFGYVASLAVFSSLGARLVVAIVLMFGAMVVETLLFVIRMQKHDDTSDSQIVIMNKKYPVGGPSKEKKDKDI